MLGKLFAKLVSSVPGAKLARIAFIEQECYSPLEERIVGTDSFFVYIFR